MALDNRRTVLPEEQRPVPHNLVAKGCLHDSHVCFEIEVSGGEVHESYIKKRESDEAIGWS